MTTPETNSRFRQLAEGQVVEMISVNVQLRYQPKGLQNPQSLVATWWGVEHFKIGDSYIPTQEGRVMESRLSDHPDTTCTVYDPVLQQEVTLSAAGWVAWAVCFYDLDYNRQFPVAVENDDEEDPVPDPPE